MTKQIKYGHYYRSLSNEPLLIALVMAAIVHVVALMGIRFSTPEPQKINRSLDVTLINTPVKNTPKEAKFLAQDNQIGAGEKIKKPEPPAQNLPSQGNRQKKQITKKAAENNKPKAQQKLVAQQAPAKKKMIPDKPGPVSNKEHVAHISAESLHQQVAQLGAEIRLQKPSSENNKIKFVDSVSAHKYIASQYLKDWEGKVERTGNMNYPEVAAKKNFSATLIMDVGIKADGSIYSMRINKSSGNPALDEAAKRIVRMSAPFAPLPTELLKELNVLVITRVWKFSDESGLVTR